MVSPSEGVIRAYRIADRRHPIFDSMGAYLNGGRWNSVGRHVIYGAETAEKFSPGGGYCLNWVIDSQGRRLARIAPRGPELTIRAIDELADKTAMPQ